MYVNPVCQSYQKPSRGINPNTYAQQYANQKGISLEDAKAELKAKYGDPKL